MTRLVQMKLPGDAIAVATKVNLDIGVIVDVVHSTPLWSIAVMVNVTSVAGTPPGLLTPVRSTRHGCDSP